MNVPDWLQTILYSPWLPIVLFLGAFGDAFILTSLFIFGEVIFIGTGYAIANLENFYLLPIIWLGAVLGDGISFFIGQRYGPSIVTKWIKNRAKWRLNFLRAKKLLRRRGIFTVFSARLAGPISKFIPFIAGTLKMPVNYFFLASFAGVIVGSAQFVLTGWLIGKGLGNSELWQQYLPDGFVLPLAIIFLLIIAVVVYKHKRNTH